MKKYELRLLILLIFVLILSARITIHFMLAKQYKARERIELTHTFLKIPLKNEFQQYFYEGNILVTLPLYPTYGYGDKIELKGVVEEYTSNKDNSLTKKLIVKNPEVKMVQNKGLAVLKFVRQKVLSGFRLSLPSKESGLISGMVLGVEDGISKDFKEELKRSGMLHVVVASGSNAVLVAGIIFTVLSQTMKKRLAILFTVGGVFFYAFLTGFDPPIVRASIMAAFGFSALLLGRQRVALLALMFSGWLMLMVNPDFLFDVGFQLSFSASLGIILFQKVIDGIFHFIPVIAKEDFSTTLAAQIGALPFLLFAFGQVNVFSLFINILLLWTVPIIMLLGLAGALISLIFPIFSQPIILLSYPILIYFEKVVALGSRIYIPFSLESIFGPFILICYVLLLYLLLKLKIKK